MELGDGGGPARRPTDPHSRVWEDEDTREAKYSRVRRGDNVPIPENVDDVEAAAYPKLWSQNQ